MEVEWNGEVVAQLESHWRDQLRPRLSGLTDDEYFWQPVPDCWTISARRRAERRGAEICLLRDLYLRNSREV